MIRLRTRRGDLDMSEAEVLSEQDAPRETPPAPKYEKVFETRAPFDLSDELQARVDANGVADTIEHLKANGYGYVRAAGSPDFNARLRETIIRIAHENTPVERRSLGGVPTCCCTRIPSSRR